MAYCTFWYFSLRFCVHFCFCQKAHKVVMKWEHVQCNTNHDRKHNAYQASLAPFIIYVTHILYMGQMQNRVGWFDHHWVIAREASTNVKALQAFCPYVTFVPSPVWYPVGSVAVTHRLYTFTISTFVFIELVASSYSYYLLVFSCAFTFISLLAFASFL